jgi:hypothetical protein
MCVAATPLPETMKHSELYRCRNPNGPVQYPLDSFGVNQTQAYEADEEYPVTFDTVLGPCVRLPSSPMNVVGPPVQIPSVLEGPLWSANGADRDFIELRLALQGSLLSP